MLLVARKKAAPVRGRPFPVRDGSAAPAGADFLEPLVEDVLQLRDRPALGEHVPVGTRRLGLLLLRLGAVDQSRDAAVELALPGGRHLGVDGERRLELVALGAEVLSGLPGSQLGVAVGLVADCAKTAAAQHAFAHDRLSPRSWCCSRWCNERRGRGIPRSPKAPDRRCDGCVNATSVTGPRMFPSSQTLAEM